MFCLFCGIFNYVHSAFWNFQLCSVCFVEFSTMFFLFCGILTYVLFVLWNFICLLSVLWNSQLCSFCFVEFLLCSFLFMEFSTFFCLFYGMFCLLLNVLVSALCFRMFLLYYFFVSCHVIIQNFYIKKHLLVFL